MNSVLKAARTQLKEPLLQRGSRTIHSTAVSLSRTNDVKSEHEDKPPLQETKQSKDEPKKKKTLTELDNELRAAMEGRSGDGGLAGAELEGGKAVSMKRGVRDNMFRYI